MTVQDLQLAVGIYHQLKRNAQKLHRLDEKFCNGEIADEEFEKKEKKIMADAQDYADNLSLIAYHQSDPRGASLYLIDKTMDYTNYSRGVAVY